MDRPRVCLARLAPARATRPMMATMATMAALAALAVGGAAPAAAQPDPGKAIAAVRAPGPIHLDGSLDDPAWRAAPPVSDFTQKEPRFGAPPSHATEVRFAYDGDALYVAARMWDTPGATRTVITRRDETRGAERFIVSFDPYRTRRVAYSFAVTVAGVRADWIHTDDSEGNRDASWDPVWSAATRVLPDGWSAELRIPWSQLRYPDGPAPWGVNLNRFIPDRNEDDFWISVPRERTAWASYMGELRGLRGLPHRRGIELRPYLAGSVAVSEDPADLDPAANLGLDARIGLGSSLGLDLTVNPDFGQVEADPAIVNLSAFEVGLPERRPFFVAGNEVFASAPALYFYSRRVGAVPYAAVPDDAEAVPAQVRILGAAKLSGRLGERGTIGALVAVTDAADAATPGGPVTVAPLTGWAAARAERELGASRVAATLTAVGRDTSDPRLAALLPDAALAGGVDGVLRWDDGGWEVRAAAGGSTIHGDPDAITAVQTSSTHYFQQPDVDHKTLDPDRTSLSGWHGGLGLSRRSGDVRGDAWLNLESPGFDLNPTGRLQSADEVSTGGAIGWWDRTPSERIHAWSASLAAESSWTMGGDRREASVGINASLTTPGFIDGWVSTGYFTRGLSDTLTRGGPMMATGAGVYVNAGLSWRGTSDVSWSTFVNGAHAPAGSTGAGGGATLSLRAGDRLRLDLSPQLRVATDRRQYLATVDDPAATDTFGRRYVFAAVDLIEVGTQLRAALTLTPDLAIDLYVEPFAARGRYHDLGELPSPGAGSLHRYVDVTRTGSTVIVGDAGFTLDEPDFTARSLRSTAVLRWEPRAGSTLFVVWQQDRGSGEARARAIGPALLDAFRAAGGHTLAVKLSWWFAR